jgi:hypothetical protein
LVAISTRRSSRRLTQEGDRLAQVQFALGGFVEQTVELIEDRRQLQPSQHRLERLVVGADHQLPPAARPRRRDDER